MINMDLSNMKKSGTNEIVISDSLNAPLLELKIKNNNNTIRPNTKELVIVVQSKKENEADKTYVFTMKESLQKNGEESDEFILTPELKQNKLTMRGYVKRMDGTEETLKYQPITLFEGTNYISTNYENATIDIIYPQANDFSKYFLFDALFQENQTDSNFSIDDIYFKDAFTKVDDLINMTANNLNINCLTSQNENFSLDQDGNLTVKSITSIEQTPTPVNFLEVYPIGSIYLNVSSANPSTYFGGVWEQIKDTFLLASGEKWEGGTTGGEENHTLSLSELPRHFHKVEGDAGRYPGWGTESGWGVNNYFGDKNLGRFRTEPEGNNQPHNNMPPYLAIYVWKRIA